VQRGYGLRGSRRRGTAKAMHGGRSSRRQLSRERRLLRISRMCRRKVCRSRVERRCVPRQQGVSYESGLRLRFPPQHLGDLCCAGGRRRSLWTRRGVRGLSAPIIRHVVLEPERYGGARVHAPSGVEPAMWRRVPGTVRPPRLPGGPLLRVGSNRRL